MVSRSTESYESICERHRSRAFDLANELANRGEIDRSRSFVESLSGVVAAVCLEAELDSSDAADVIIQVRHDVALRIATAMSLKPLRSNKSEAQS